ncbi:M16 family metallopeptidase [Schaalia naturae]|uniref:M16 family metallopeptidase n=2 Tax=Schaalia naturae TaxID=635203 RepID=A0ABW2SMW3_9ACTO
MDGGPAGVTRIAPPQADPLDLPVEGPDLTASLEFDDGDTCVRRTVLPGGVRVLSQDVPATHSVGVSLWVPVGSRDETPAHAGSTHFLEHLLFKGTARRSALDIAVAFDAVGGESNAETGKESTNYWARVRDQDLGMAVDVLTDMVAASRIDPADFDLERGVILDELAMAEDSPTEVVHDAFAAAAMGDTPLGRPVGGTPEAIRAIGRDDVWEHYRSAYGPGTLVVAVAGHVDHDRLLDEVAAALERAGWAGGAGGPRPRRPEDPAEPVAGASQAREIVRRREVEQAHVVVGCPSMRAGDPRRRVMSVLLGVLGGSMSSRLFQEVRERRGLAYSTYAFDSPFADTGFFGMYAGTAPEKVGQVEDIMSAQLESLASDGPTEEEMARVRGQLRGGLALGLEDNWSRMARLGRAEMLGRYYTVEATLAGLDAVEAEDVRGLAGELAAGPRSRALVLPAEP